MFCVRVRARACACCSKNKMLFTSPYLWHCQTSIRNQRFFWVWDFAFVWPQILINDIRKGGLRLWCHHNLINITLFFFFAFCLTIPPISRIRCHIYWQMKALITGQHRCWPLGLSILWVGAGQFLWMCVCVSVRERMASRMASRMRMASRRASRSATTITSQGRELRVAVFECEKLQEHLRPSVYERTGGYLQLLQSAFTHVLDNSSSLQVRSDCTIVHHPPYPSSLSLTRRIIISTTSCCGFGIMCTDAVDFPHSSLKTTI